MGAVGCLLYGLGVGWCRVLLFPCSPSPVLACFAAVGVWVFLTCVGGCCFSRLQSMAFVLVLLLGFLSSIFGMDLATTISSWGLRMHVPSSLADGS
ncbi:hypothetical protein U1Q18_025733 [Sarracenia purpurea var. burkii]